MEAARIDGASEFKIFFSIIIPYLEQTILVIWTLITIIVLRIFDIIFAMTNGEWQTGVLANLMYDWMFRGGGDSGEKCFSNCNNDWRHTYFGLEFI